MFLKITWNFAYKFSLQFLHGLWASGSIAFVMTWRNYWRILYLLVHIGLYSLVVIPPLAFLFLVRFCIVFVVVIVIILVSHAIFFSFSIVCSYYSLSIYYTFYLNFWGTSFSKQSSVSVGERGVGSVKSTHCSNALSADFEQVIVCWKSVTLDYREFLFFF